MTGTEILRETAQYFWLGLAAVVVWQWRRRRNRPAAWAAASFGAIALILVVAKILGPEADQLRVGWAIKGLVVALIAFPYLLYRFTAAFKPFPRFIEYAATGLTTVLATWAVFLPLPLPERGEPRPGWLAAYTVLFLIQWVGLFGTVSVRLWRAGKGQATVPRRRTRFMAVGAAGLNLSVVLSSVTSPEPDSGMAAALQVLSLTTGVLLMIGLTPPRWLRSEWQRREGEALNQAVLNLMTAETPQQVASSLLGPTARLIGARAMVMHDPSGTVVGTFGGTEEDVLAQLAAEASRDGHPGVHRFELRSGSLSVVTGPYVPFFAPDELTMIEALGGVVDLAMERCTKLAYERRFIANAAHELRTPLTTLSGLSVTLATRRHQMQPAEVDECFDALARQGERTRVLIDNLLDLAQLEHGRQTVDPRVVLVGQVARRALEVAPPPDGRTVELNVPDEVMVLAEESRVEQMLVNLLTNAYRYGGPNIRLEAFADDDGALLVVTDDGPGVSVDVALNLFEPFGRASVGSHLGSGLGLAIVRRLANAFGGDIWYEPARPSGARFTIKLPRAA